MRIERVDLDLLLELLDGLVVFQLPLVSRSQIVVSVLVVRVDLDLLLERVDSLIVLVEPQVGAAQLVPRRLVLRFQLHHPLEKADRQFVVVVLERLQRRLMQIVSRFVGAHSSRPRGLVVQRDFLRLIGSHSPPEGGIIFPSRHRQFPAEQLQRAHGGQLPGFELIAGTILRVVALDLDSDRQVYGVLRRNRDFARRRLTPRSRPA